MAQSVISATETLGQWDEHGLSATNPRQGLNNSIQAMPKDVGMLSLPVLVTTPTCLGLRNTY